MHALHEGMEVDACLADDVGRQRVVEEVHHHGLARADVAVHVHALWQRLGNRGESRRGSRGGEEGEEGLLGGLERLDGGLLDGRLFVACEHVVQVLEVLDDVLQLSARCQASSVVHRQRTSLVLVVSQPPGLDARIVLSNRSMGPCWVRGVCPDQRLPSRT